MVQVLAHARILGPAVILGHVSGAQGASVFFELGRLRPGDKVKVTRRDGSVPVFEVTRVRRYPKNRFPTQLVYATRTTRRFG